MLKLFTVSRTVVGTNEKLVYGLLIKKVSKLCRYEAFINHFTLFSATAKKSMTRRIWSSALIMMWLQRSERRTFWTTTQRFLVSIVTVSLWNSNCCNCKNINLFLHCRFSQRQMDLCPQREHQGGKACYLLQYDRVWISSWLTPLWSFHTASWILYSGWSV